MDRGQVVSQLRAWADGVDAATGQPLAADHPGQRPDTLRVIFAALALLEDEHDAERRPAATHRALGLAARNAGRPWSGAEDDALCAAFDAGAAIAALAVQLERTRGGITARLVKLGKIEAPPGLRLRGDGGPQRATAA